jgi:hypothetical protein
MGIEWRAHCARARVCADRAAGVTSVAVSVSIAAARNSRGSCGLSGVLNAAAHAVQMSVAEARSSSGANIWSMADWSSVGLVSRWRSVWGSARDQSSTSATLRRSGAATNFVTAVQRSWF